MSPTEEKIIDKIRKLLRLADRAGTPGEAAAAAAAAQRLQAAHRIETLVLEEAGPSVVDPVGSESVQPENQARTHWRSRLALILAKANGCRAYHARNRLHVAGRTSDRETVRELFAWLCVAIDRLAIEHCGGLGATYFNNFRVGAVEAVGEKLAADVKAREETLRTTNATALVLVRKSEAAVDQWCAANLHLWSGRRAHFRQDGDARAAGREAGSSLDPHRRMKLNPARLLGAAR
jgi:hypothetical protein